MSKFRFYRALIIGFLLYQSAACNDEFNDMGELTVSIYGEDFIEKGINSEFVSDGWSINFERFLITLKDIRVGELKYASPEPIDLSINTSGLGQAVVNSALSIGEYRNPSFTIARIELSGSASKNDQNKTFNWRFDQETHYTDCETVVPIIKGQETKFEVTIHADHFFYDSLVSEEPLLKFQALANADLNENGEISQAELETADIRDYDPGSKGNVDDLWTWLIAQSQTLAHVNGEGHCISHTH